MQLTSKCSTERPFNISTFNLGCINENKRVWLQTRKLVKGQLPKNTLIDIVHNEARQEITIMKSEYGRNKVSGRSDGMPIIDIKNKQVAQTLGQNVEMITVKFYMNKVVIGVSTQEKRKAERQSKTGNKVAELFCGGGTLSKFSEMAGFEIDTVVERDDRFLEVFDKNIEAKLTICADINDIDVNDLPRDITHLQFGYPCTAYSGSNIVLGNKRKNEETAEHAHQERRDADYLSLALLEIIRHVNPRSCLIEEVSAFRHSLPFDLLIYSLEKMDYKISITEVTGSFTERKRLAIVAICDHEPVDLENLEYQTPRPISEHLDIPVAVRQFTPIENRPRESGAVRKGLGIRSHLPSDTKVRTVTTHWSRHTHISLESPTHKNHFSDFTVSEIRRIHGLPEDFNCGDKVTIARHVLGQGVVDGFHLILQRIHARLQQPYAFRSRKKKRDIAQGEQLAMQW